MYAHECSVKCSVFVPIWATELPAKWDANFNTNLLALRRTIIDPFELSEYYSFKWTIWSAVEPPISTADKTAYGAAVGTAIDVSFFSAHHAAFGTTFIAAIWTAVFFSLWTTISTPIRTTFWSTIWRTVKLTHGSTLCSSFGTAHL
jgi:hypothetical protein